MLIERRKLPYLGQQSVIFPSTSGALRDPDNFAGRWRKIRADLGVPNVSSYSFRKTVATLIDDAGLSARIGADHLGHAKVSMTQHRYMSRGRVHHEVANLLDKAVADNSGPLKTPSKRRPASSATAGYDTKKSAPGRDRTCDQPLRRRLLYPLSYGGNAQVSLATTTYPPHNPRHAENWSFLRKRRLANM